MALLLLISCLLLLPLWKFCVCSLICYAELDFFSSFAITLMGKERAGYFTLFVFKLSCNLLFCGSSSLCLGLVISGRLGVFPDHAHLLFMFKLYLGIKTPGVWPVSYSYHNIYISSVDKTQRQFGLIFDAILLPSSLPTFRVQTGANHGGHQGNSFLLLIKEDPICNSLAATFKRVVRTHSLLMHYNECIWKE